MERPRYFRKQSSSSIHTRRRSTSRRQSRRRSSSSHSHAPNIQDLLDPSLNPNDNNEPDLNEIKASLDNTLPLDYFKQDILSVIQLLRIPKWRKIRDENSKHLEINRISGALTNCVYKVSYKNYYPLLLRLYGLNVENIIDRKKELLTLHKLSERNIGPKLLGCFTNGRFEEFLNNSVTLNKDMIREPKISRMIARRMKELHAGIPLDIEESLQGSTVWNTIEKWLVLVDEIVSKSDATVEDEKAIFIYDWETFKKLVCQYRDWLYAKYDGKINIDTRLRFCHNDTQYGNLLFYSKFDQILMNEDDNDDEQAEEALESMNQKSESRTSLSVVSASDLDTDLTNQLSSLSMSSTSTTLPTMKSSHFDFKNDKKLVVIDFEYAGPNIAAYDITNHFCEWMADYNQVELSHFLDEKKYPTKEERLNLLSAYVSFTPGSQTPRFQRNPSVVDITTKELPQRVVQLYNETILWRAANSIFWMLWGVITKGTIKRSLVAAPILKDTIENGPSGNRYRIITDDSDVDPMTKEGDDEVEEIDEDNDDNFDYLGYSLQKTGIVIGDLIQLGLIDKSSVPPELSQSVKYLDCEMLAVTK